jgi:hypothetical protein
MENSTVKKCNGREFFLIMRMLCVSFMLKFFIHFCFFNNATEKGNPEKSPDFGECYNFNPIKNL